MCKWVYRLQLLNIRIALVVLGAIIKVKISEIRRNPFDISFFSYDIRFEYKCICFIIYMFIPFSICSTLSEVDCCLYERSQNIRDPRIMNSMNFA